MFPVIYEIDPDTSEATGVVHFYCCVACRESALFDHMYADAEDRGFATKLGANDPATVPANTLCEHCGKRLED